MSTHGTVGRPLALGPQSEAIWRAHASPSMQLAFLPFLSLRASVVAVGEFTDTQFTIALHPPTTGTATHPHTGAWVGQWKLRKTNMPASPEELVWIEKGYQRWLEKSAWLHVLATYSVPEIEEASKKQQGKQYMLYTYLYPH